MVNALYNMELSSPEKNSIKIKQKNVSITVDSTSGSPDAVIVLDKEKIGNIEGILYIEGPGEYEIKGTRISGKQIGDETVYEIFNGTDLVRLIPSSVLKSVSGEDEYLVTVVKKETPDFDESEYSSLDSEVTVVYGDSQNIISHSTIKKVDKLTPKNIGDYKGSILFLGE